MHRNQTPDVAAPPTDDVIQPRRLRHLIRQHDDGTIVTSPALLRSAPTLNAEVARSLIAQLINGHVARALVVLGDRGATSTPRYAVLDGYHIVQLSRKWFSGELTVDVDKLDRVGLGGLGRFKSERVPGSDLRVTRHPWLRRRTRRIIEDRMTVAVRVVPTPTVEEEKRVFLSLNSQGTAPTRRRNRVEP